FSSRRRHTRWPRDWSSDVCSSDLMEGAAVAETSYTPFAARKGARPVRLIVRRVPPTPGSQLALYVDYSHHPLITNRPGEMLALEIGRASCRERGQSWVGAEVFDDR